MGKMKDLAIECEDAFAAFHLEPIEAAERERYMAWVADRIADGAAPSEVTPEAYYDELVSQAEQAAEDAMWRAGCGPRRGAL